MAAGKKRTIGVIRVAGIVLVLSGLLILIKGKTAIGTGNIALGMMFIIIGAAAARKAASPSDGTAVQPPADGGAGRP